MTIRQLQRALLKRILAGHTRPFYERFCLLPQVRAVHGSVHILSLRLGENDHTEVFVKLAEDALTLIERTDPSANRMVQREIRYLIETYLTSRGNYNPAGRICKVNLKACKIDPTLPEYEWWVAYFACVVVHEATHGRLFSLGIPYTKKTRERVERLCVLRAQHFANRWKSDNYDSDTLVTPFDASNWHPTWNRTALHRKRRKKEMLEFLNDFGVAPWLEPLFKRLGNTND